MNGGPESGGARVLLWTWQVATIKTNDRGDRTPQVTIIEEGMLPEGEEEEVVEIRRRGRSRITGRTVS